MRINKFIPTILFLLILVTGFQVKAQNPYDKFIIASAEEVIKIEGNTSSLWDYFIYPVPANESLNVKITKGDVTIDKIVVLNEDGVEVLTLTNQYREKIKLNLEGLKPGKYIIKIVSNQYQMSKTKRFYVTN